MRARPLSILFAALFACVPTAIDYAGKLCTVDHPCPSPFVCSPEGTCLATLVLTDGGLALTDGGALPDSGPPSSLDAGDGGDAGPGGLPDSGPPPFVNLLVNPDFEDAGVTPPHAPFGWSSTPGSGVTIGTVTSVGATPPHSGSRAAVVTNTSGTTMDFGITPTTPFYDVVAHATYCASAWLNRCDGDAGLDVTLQLAMHVGAGTSSSSNGFTPSGDTFWNKIASSQLSGAGADYMTVSFTMLDAGPGECFYLDNVRVWQSSSTYPCSY